MRDRHHDAHRCHVGIWHWALNDMAAGGRLFASSSATRNEKGHSEGWPLLMLNDPTTIPSTGATNTYFAGSAISQPISMARTAILGAGQTLRRAVARLLVAEPIGKTEHARISGCPAR